jgi:hypothetical protein
VDARLPVRDPQALPLLGQERLRKADICPALSLTDLFQTASAAKTQAGIRGLLGAVPPYFSQAVITSDRKTATLAFGIRLMPLDEQQKVIDAMRDRLDPPAGVTARMAGLQVLGAEANSSLSSPLRRLATLLAGLLAVGLALLLVYRRWERAWVPLVPIALASGWSALVLFALRVPLNPMSATLGALVIAISTEFSVLLTARYREERAAGSSRATRCGAPTRRPARRWSPRRDRDRRLRGARALRRADAVRLRARDGRRPVGLAARRARGAAGGADAGRAARGLAALRPPRWWRSPRSPHERARAATAARRDLALHLDRRRAGGAGLAYITLNTLGPRSPARAACRTDGKLPPFAVPIATSKLEGDAQVDPEQGVQGARAGRPQLLPAG